MDIYLLENIETAKIPFERFASLMPQRIKKAERFRFEKDRLMCIGAGLLLWHCLQAGEEDVLYLPNGKPYLKDGRCFSISHSRETAALAFGDRPVGIDIEELRAFPREIIPQVFSAEEVCRIGTDEKKPYLLWSVKESVYKAGNEGALAEPKEITLSAPTEKGVALYRGKQWYYFAKEYCGMSVAAASDVPVDEINIHELTAKELLKHFP